MTIEEIFNLNQGTGGLHNLLNVHDVSLDESDRICVKLQVTEHVLNPHGAAHGGTIFALCDMAVGSYMALHKKNAVTLDSTIHFYRPGKIGFELTAIVNERKVGKTTSIFLVEVIDNDGTHIADATFTMFS